MKMTKIYALAFMFPGETANHVARLKSLLRKKIDWYHSCNSEAHASIIGFEADWRDLTRIIRAVEDFCFYNSPFAGRLIGTATFPNAGTFYLTPDPESARRMQEYTKAIFRDLFHKRLHKIEPHVSLARRLSKEDIAIAEALFTDLPIDIPMVCNGIFLRELDPLAGQYRVVHFFPFLGRTRYVAETGQLNLFS